MCCKILACIFILLPYYFEKTSQHWLHGASGNVLDPIIVGGGGGTCNQLGIVDRLYQIGYDTKIRLNDNSYL